MVTIYNNRLHEAIELQSATHPKFLNSIRHKTEDNNIVIYIYYCVVQLQK